MKSGVDDTKIPNKISHGTLLWALHKRNERIFVSSKMERTPML